MRTKYVILLYLFVIIAVISGFPSVSFSSVEPEESLSQYITDLSQDIHSLIDEIDYLEYKREEEIKLQLLLSPWGELKDAYIAESSGNKKLEKACLEVVLSHDRYQPFPEALGKDERWIDVPLIFKVRDLSQYQEDSETVDPGGVEPILGKSSDYVFGDLGVGVLEITDLFRTGAGSRELTALGVEDAIDIASEGHMAREIAEEEMELSRLKIREARRALYPVASLNYLETTGKTTAATQDFTDKEYKIKFEYPLYYGWRLKYAVDQAVSNMKAQKHNYNKVLQDLRFDVEMAFYSYLSGKVNVRLQKSLLIEAKEIFDMSKKIFDLDLITKLEFLQVDSQMRQIVYQLTSSENDLAMAKLQLQQAMNVEDSEDLEELVDMDIDMMMGLEPRDIDVSLDQCMDLAFRYRPDLRSKGYMLEFNEYEQKIAKSKDQLKVDLTGSYGHSGGAFETETLDLGTDWYLGIKVSKPLGGNTISYTRTQEETSEKHGQSTRTESVSDAVEFGILDNMQSFSDKKQAHIALKKAKDELEKMKDSVLKEVNEAYLNYKKGLIQVRTNFNKIRYKEQELELTKVRSDLNEIQLSGLLQAHMSLTDEKLFYIEALVSLYQSLARLNKATGYALFLDEESFMLAER